MSLVFTGDAAYGDNDPLLTACIFSGRAENGQQYLTEAIALGFLRRGKPLNVSGLLQEILVTFWTWNM